jgi:hypothetical protein
LAARGRPWTAVTVLAAGINSRRTHGSAGWPGGDWRGESTALPRGCGRPGGGVEGGVTKQLGQRLRQVVATAFLHLLIGRRLVSQSIKASCVVQLCRLVS